MSTKMLQTRSSRSGSKVWLIGYPLEMISGARLPSGREVLRNFVYYQRSKQLSISESAHQVHDQLIPFWMKSRLPTRHKNHIVKKIKDLYAEHVRLSKNRSRCNNSDRLNRRKFTEKLDKLFDISHANSKTMIRNEEDLNFLKLQQESRSGSIGSLDRKLAAREKRSAKRKEQVHRREVAAAAATAEVPEVGGCDSHQTTPLASASSSEEDGGDMTESDNEFDVKPKNAPSSQNSIQNHFTLYSVSRYGSCINVDGHRPISITDVFNNYSDGN